MIAHARLLMRVGRLYEGMAPGMLAAASRVANIKSGIVVIHADHGAVAAKLRQMAGRLRDEFLQRGVECSGIEVRVQPPEPAPAAPPPLQRPLSPEALASVRGAMQSLPENSALRAALARLLARVAGPPATK